MRCFRNNTWKSMYSMSDSELEREVYRRCRSYPPLPSCDPADDPTGELARKEWRSGCYSMLQNAPPPEGQDQLPWEG
jgi:hypothetical protein